MTRRKKTIAEFIEQSTLVHNGKFDYSRSIYKGSNKPIEIICPVHGSFWQIATTHSKGMGCRQCSNDATRKTLKQFIEEANAIHNYKYSYTLAIYSGAHKPTTIICPLHGAFTQIAHDHLWGYGCPKCKAEKISNLKRKDPAQFIKEANIVHHNYYTYDNVLYFNNRMSVTITCTKHGDFNQAPDNHLNGHGCPKCVSNISMIETQWLDHIQILQEHRHKTLWVDGKRYNVDAFDHTTNTIYEFYGDFWHGNPQKYNSYDINEISHKTYGELYANTINREIQLKNAGYIMITIWESNFREILKNQKLSKKIKQ